MKKFLICIIFLIAFSGISSAVLASTGFDGKSKMIETLNQNYSFSLEETNQMNELIDKSVNKSLHNLNKNNIVFDIVLFECSDFRDFFNQAKIDLLDSYFNDDDRSNEIYSVHEYFIDASYGKASIYANLNLFKDNRPRSDYYNQIHAIAEFGTYSRAFAKSKQVAGNYGDGNAYGMIFAGHKVYDGSSRLWAHCLPDFTFISLNYEHALELDVLYHEIFHTFMIADQYCYNNSENTPLGSWELISIQDGPTNSLMYNKKMAGWVESSNYSDSKETEIETINNSDTNNGANTLRLTLHPTCDTTGTRAYKFGMRSDKDSYFMIEYRKSNPNGLDKYLYEKQCLIVYRVNDTRERCGNCFDDQLRGIEADYETFEVYIWRPNEDDSVRYSGLKAGDVCGGLKMNSYSTLYYEDKTIAKFLIDNITFNDDGTASFDFQNLQNVTAISGTVYSMSSRLSGMKILVNGIETTTSDKKGEFLITGINNNATLSIVDPNGNFTFNDTIIEPTNHDLKIYANQIITPSVRIVDGSSENTYKIYQYKNNEWVYLDSFNGSEILEMKNIPVNTKFKVSGYCVTDYEFTLVSNTLYRIPQTIPKQAEEKDFIGKVVDTVVDLPGQVVDFAGDIYDGIAQGLGDLYNGIADGLGDIFNGISSWF